MWIVNKEGQNQISGLDNQGGEGAVDWDKEQWKNSRFGRKCDFRLTQVDFVVPMEIWVVTICIYHSVDIANPSFSGILCEEISAVNLILGPLPTLMVDIVI